MQKQFQCVSPMLREFCSWNTTRLAMFGGYIWEETPIILESPSLPKGKAFRQRCITSHKQFRRSFAESIIKLSENDFVLFCTGKYHF